MTKRFLYELHTGYFRDNGSVMGTKDVIDTLNNQYEEITELKNELTKLQLENKNLHKGLDYISKNYDEQIYKLEQENQFLKNALKLDETSKELLERKKMVKHNGSNKQIHTSIPRIMYKP